MAAESPSATSSPLAPFSSKEELLEERKKRIGFNVALNYKDAPLCIVRGEGQYLFDENGHRYLDCVNNVCHVGHCNPAVAAATCAQLQQLNTNSRYLHPTIVEYARRLSATLPPPPVSAPAQHAGVAGAGVASSSPAKHSQTISTDGPASSTAVPSQSREWVLFWVNSGSEANDLAVRLARAHTGRRGMITTEGAYHGHTTEVIHISPYKYDTEGGAGRPNHIKEAPLPCVHSGLFRGGIDDEGLGLAYAGEVSKLICELQREEATEEGMRNRLAGLLGNLSLGHGLSAGQTGPAAAAGVMAAKGLCPVAQPSPPAEDPTASAANSRRASPTHHHELMPGSLVGPLADAHHAHGDDMGSSVAGSDPHAHASVASSAASAASSSPGLSGSGVGSDYGLLLHPASQPSPVASVGPATSQASVGHTKTSVAPARSTVASVASVGLEDAVSVSSSVSSSSLSPSEPSSVGPSPVVSPAKGHQQSLQPRPQQASHQQHPDGLQSALPVPDLQQLLAWASGACAPSDGLKAGLAGFISESVLSCGGQVVPPKGYLQAVYSAVRAAGGVCIADEVQVGFGRVGSSFWAFEQQGVVPDILTLGKPLGNGFPVALVVTTPEIARSFANGMEYFNTFGGNPVAGAAALATLEQIQSLGLQAHAAAVGEVLLKGFGDLQRLYPHVIGSVRGQGLMVGLEILKAQRSTGSGSDGSRTHASELQQKGSGIDNHDQCGVPAAGPGRHAHPLVYSHGHGGDRHPDPSLASRIKYTMLSRHRMLLSTDGMADNIIKLKPPMVFTEDNAREVIDGLGQVLAELLG